MPLGNNVNNKDSLISKTTTKTKADNVNNKNITPPNKTIQGTPSKNPEATTYKTKKQTFYVKEELLEKLHNFAYWDRHSITEALNRALEDGLKGKTTKQKPRK